MTTTDSRCVVELSIIVLTICLSGVGSDIIFSSKKPPFPQKKAQPLYSGKARVSGECVIFAANRSFLLRKRIIEVLMNQRELHIDSNNRIDSTIRFCKGKLYEVSSFNFQLNIIFKPVTTFRTKSKIFIKFL